MPPTQKRDGKEEAENSRLKTIQENLDFYLHEGKREWDELVNQPKKLKALFVGIILFTQVNLLPQGIQSETIDGEQYSVEKNKNIGYFLTKSFSTLSSYSNHELQTFEKTMNLFKQDEWNYKNMVKFGNRFIVSQLKSYKKRDEDLKVKIFTQNSKPSNI